ncbi:MAG: glycosyltransferase [Gaiellaceae bacterium MAG52_C11]|nr:glycosyltransferase [Candidatus Gaiellasilicea maunaloa]
MLFATPTYWPAVAFGGPVWVARELTEGLAARGHRVDVVTTSLRSIGEPPAERVRTHTRTQAGVHVHELATPLRYRWMGITPSLPLVLRSLPRPDVVHVFGYRDAVTTLTAAWAHACSIPYVFEPLDMYVRRYRNVPLKRAFDRMVGEKVARGAALVLAVSELERAELIAAGLAPARVVVRPNGFPAPHTERGSALRARLGLGPEAPLVLNVGRISFKKGLDLLLEAVAGILDVHLAIVGPDDGDGTFARLEALRARPELAGRVHLLPPFDDRQPRELYGEADVFVLPSRNESFGMVAAEAAAAGTPVVLTDRCGVAALLGERAAVIVPPEVEPLREAIVRVLADPGLRKRLGAGGREVAREVSWASVVAEQEQLYRRALG